MNYKIKITILIHGFLIKIIQIIIKIGIIEKFELEEYFLILYSQYKKIKMDKKDI